MSYRSRSPLPPTILSPFTNGTSTSTPTCESEEYKALAASDLSDRILLLVGAATDSIASSIAIRLAAHGAQLVLVDTAKWTDRLKTLAANCDTAALHGNRWQFRGNKWQRVQKALIWPMEEYSSTSAIAAMVNTIVETFGRIDGLIFKTANASSSGLSFSGTTSDSISAPGLLAALDRTINEELMLLVKMAQAVVPQLEVTGGAIVNVSTTVVVKPDPSQLVTATSRGAIDMLVKCLSLELGPKKVRINSVNHILTPSTGPPILGLEVNQSMMDAYLTQIEKDHHGQRPLRAEDVASAVLYLLTPRSSFLNGTNIIVDGGKTL